MQYTLSLHNGGESCVKQDHNSRRYQPPNADPDRTNKNITLYEKPIREAYHLLFDRYVEEFNKKQISNGHKERAISNYYQHLLSNPKKQTAYEFIVQIGGRADNGYPETAVQALQEYYRGWKEANPNMVCIGAYIHLDEETPHLHLDYIPIATSTRGMRVQNTLNKALQAQGFTSHGIHDTAQIRWVQAERDRFREICSNLDIDVAAQGIGRKRHLSVDEYKDACDQVSSAVQTVDMLNKDICFWSKRLSEVQESVRSKRNDVKLLNSEIQERRAYVSRLDSDIKERRDSVENLDSAIKQHTAKAETLSSYLGDIEKNLAERKRDADNQDRRLHTIKSDISTGQSKLSKTKKQLAASLNDLSAAEKQLAARYKQLNEIKDSISDISLERENAYSELERVRSDLEQAKSDWENEYSELYSQLNWLNAFYDEVRSEYPEYTDSVKNTINSRFAQLCEDEMEL